MTHTADSIYARNRRLKWERNDDNDSWTAVTEDGNGICIAFKDPLDYEQCGKQAEVLNRFNEMSKNNRSKLK
tara:strand:+ start:31 stop:246 length:216 start_codon:yes stop_codon:yes gene_type:complete